VREVEHVHQSENDRKSGSQQEDEAAESQAVDDQLKGVADGEVMLKKPPTWLRRFDTSGTKHAFESADSTRLGPNVSLK
jgi:hypothetical protein